MSTQALSDEDALRAGAALVYPEWSDEEYAAPPGEDDLAPSSAGPRIERIGPSYRVTDGALSLTFREVRTDRELSADVAVSYGGRHLFRSTATLSLTARDRLAKTAAELAGIRDATAREDLRRSVFAAVEAVLEAEEQIGAPVDLRRAGLTLPSGGLHVARPLWPSGSVSLTAPGAAGKSTMARAQAVSLASGRTIIPGIEPVGPPPAGAVRRSRRSGNPLALAQHRGHLSRDRD